MPNGIPRKGEVLTQLSHFWFARSRPSFRIICCRAPASLCRRS
jgi:hypothetical protein